MADTTLKKVQASSAPTGPKGQAYLVSGKRLAMRYWDEQPGNEGEAHAHDYETVGYVLEGRAVLHLEGQELELTPGDSWLVPADVRHHYEIVEPFKAVEATAPPARSHGRDGV